LSILSAVTSATTLLAPTTPQGTAFLWIVNDDPARLDPCSADPERIVQRYALAALYYSTVGGEWTDGTGWLTDPDECAWAGVACSADGGGGGSFRVVTGVVLGENNLQGALPSEVGALSSLEELDVFDNAIGGTVPAAVGSLPAFRLLDVEKNVLTGPAFVDLSEAASIESYRVSFNALTGTVPADLGARTTLKEVWAAGNSLAGTIPTGLASLPILGASVLRFVSGWAGLRVAVSGAHPLVAAQAQNLSFCTITASPGRFRTSRRRRPCLGCSSSSTRSPQRSPAACSRTRALPSSGSTTTICRAPFRR
jgi:hypothetical protein